MACEALVTEMAANAAKDSSRFLIMGLSYSSSMLVRLRLETILSLCDGMKSSNLSIEPATGGFMRWFSFHFADRENIK